MISAQGRAEKCKSSVPLQSFSRRLSCCRVMRPTPGNDLILGNLVGRNATLTLPKESRDKHLYVCGGTGTGKSKFLENLIRQDIKDWRKTKCGLILLDAHGALYDSLIRWL